MGREVGGNESLKKKSCMKPENKAFLEDNRDLWITLRDAQYLRFPHQGIKDGLVRVMREEFRPGYTADLWCGNCVATMVREVYTEFEKWEAAQNTTINNTAYSSDPPVPTEPTGEQPHDPPADPESEPAPPENPVTEPNPEPRITEPAPPAPVQTKANFPSHKHHRRR